MVSRVKAITLPQKLIRRKKPKDKCVENRLLQDWGMKLGK